MFGDHHCDFGDLNMILVIMVNEDQGPGSSPGSWSSVGGDRPAKREIMVGKVNIELEVRIPGRWLIAMPIHGSRRKGRSRSRGAEVRMSSTCGSKIVTEFLLNSPLSFILRSKVMHN